MKASEYIERIQELIKVVGDAEVVVETSEDIYETAYLPDAFYRKKLGQDVYIIQKDEKNEKVVPLIVIHELNWYMGREEDGCN